MFKFIQKSAKPLLTASVGLLIAVGSFNTNASGQWNSVSEAVPFKTTPAEAYSPADLANAIGVGGNAATESYQLNWATHALNTYGVARVSTSNDKIATVWHSDNPNRGPYKGHTGLVLKQCDRAAKPTCFSRAI